MLLIFIKNTILSIRNITLNQSSHWTWKSTFCIWSFTECLTASIDAVQKKFNYLNHRAHYITERSKNGMKGSRSRYQDKSECKNLSNLTNNMCLRIYDCLYSIIRVFLSFSLVSLFLRLSFCTCVFIFSFPLRSSVWIVPCNKNNRSR